MESERQHSEKGISGERKKNIDEVKKLVSDQLISLDARTGKQIMHGSIYLPPNTSGTIQIPGTRGVGEWSGGAFDPETGVMYVGTNDIPNAVHWKK